MTKLSVNINKVATIRNARGGNTPNLLQVARDCEAFGADGITVHPRPDERHIRRADVPALRAVLSTEFNIEGYPTNVKLIVSDDGFGKNEYIETTKSLVVVTAPGPGCGKMATCTKYFR